MGFIHANPSGQESLFPAAATAWRGSTAAATVQSQVMGEHAAAQKVHAMPGAVVIGRFQFEPQLSVHADSSTPRSGLPGVLRTIVGPQSHIIHVERTVAACCTATSP